LPGRYMRLLSREFVAAFPNRILNIHPSLLPAFPGLEAQEQAFAYGAKVTGCTVHFVDEELDHGAIVVQRAVSVLETDDETLARGADPEGRTRGIHRGDCAGRERGVRGARRKYVKSGERGIAGRPKITPNRPSSGMIPTLRKSSAFISAGRLCPGLYRDG